MGLQRQKKFKKQTNLDFTSGSKDKKIQHLQRQKKFKNRQKDFFRHKHQKKTEKGRKLTDLCSSFFNFYVFIFLVSCYFSLFWFSENFTMAKNKTMKPITKKKKKKKKK